MLRDITMALCVWLIFFQGVGCLDFVGIWDEDCRGMFDDWGMVMRRITSMGVVVRNHFRASASKGVLGGVSDCYGNFLGPLHRQSIDLFGVGRGCS